MANTWKRSRDYTEYWPPELPMYWNNPISHTEHMLTSFRNSHLVTHTPYRMVGRRSKKKRRKSPSLNITRAGEFAQSSQVLKARSSQTRKQKHGQKTRRDFDQDETTCHGGRRPQVVCMVLSFPAVFSGRVCACFLAVCLSGLWRTGLSGFGKSLPFEASISITSVTRQWSLQCKNLRHRDEAVKPAIMTRILSGSRLSDNYSSSLVQYSS